MNPKMSTEYFAYMYKSHVKYSHEAGNKPDSLRICIRKTIHTYVWKGCKWPSKEVTDSWTQKTQDFMNPKPHNISKGTFTIIDVMKCGAKKNALVLEKSHADF